MTKYDGLDARKELEQAIARDLEAALHKRGFTIRHNGTSTTPAKAGVSDIEVWNDYAHINFEATKTTKSSADREMLSVADHLEKTKRLFQGKRCYAAYVSPETHYRMANAIRDHNTARENEIDMKIMPISFANFDLLITRLSEAHKDVYTGAQLEHVFSRYADFIDDERALKVLYEELFHEDKTLKKDIETKELAKWQKLEEDVIRDLDRIENRLREYGIAVAGEAIRQLIYLVFIKLYEEKRAVDGKGKNRFLPKTFIEFQEFVGEKETKRAINKLFEQIKNEKEFQEAKLFTEHDLLAEKMNDDFVLEEIIKPLDRYPFYKTKVDGLGAVYEVLALRSSKDVKAGQFFTPINVVNFMVELTELDPTDVCLDPACGTGRFLIWSMDDMLSKVAGKDAEQRKNGIRRKQLYGTDNDQNVAKLAKMNMYIHGDGKGNIFDDDGLLLYKTHNMDEYVDAILTNPPLGKLNYRRPEYDQSFMKRMEVIPRKEKNAETQILGNVMKGGALFLDACWHYLKSVRDPDATPEWRGGKLSIILDEAILNTDDYRKTCDFLKNNFYLKAIISLTTDTFVPVAKAATKTSIVYAIKKDDPTAIQSEPIFFAHAEKVGMDTKKRVCANYLMNPNGKDIVSKYKEFKHAVLDSYDGLVFNKKKFEDHRFKQGRLDD